MATIPDAYLRRIQRDLPANAPEHLDDITDGMVNDVVVVDRTWVYRFAKHDWSKPLMQHEAKVLDLVRAHVDVPVPHLELLGDDCCRYPFLAGTPLTRRALLRWSEADRNAVLKSVVRFVAQIQAIPTAEATAAGIGPSDTNRDANLWRTLHADLTTTLYPLLMRHQRDYVDDLFAPVLDGVLTFEHRRTLVYGDVASYHLLVDPRERRLAAVLELGTAGIGDPAVDVAALLHVFTVEALRSRGLPQKALRRHKRRPWHSRLRSLPKRVAVVTRAQETEGRCLPRPRGCPRGRQTTSK